MKEKIDLCEAPRSSSPLMVFVKETSWRLVILTLIFLPALLIQNRELEKVRTTPRVYRDSMYLPSGRNIHLISLGYDQFMADFIWLRAIQAFGGHWGTDRNYTPIFHLFDVITDLDPHFLEAYTFGNLVIGDEGGDQKLGLTLIDKGIIKNPRKYKLPYWGGYVAYWQMNNPDLAKYYYARALKCSDVPGFVNRIFAYMELKSGRFHVAFEKYIMDMLDAIDQNDEVVEWINRNRLPDIINEWQIFTLKQACISYRETRHAIPANIHDLEQSGSIEPYNFIHIPRLLQAVAYFRAQPGRISEKFQEIVDAGTIKNATFIPPHPHGYWYQTNPELTYDEEEYIIDGKVVVERLKDFLRTTRFHIWDFRVKNGRYPYSIHEIYGEPFKTKEPLGGEWLYSFHDGRFKSSVMPLL